MTDPELMRIGDLAELTGKTVRALHLYEERGLLSPAARSQGGFRLYDAENVRRIRYIDGLQRIGYKLEEIGGLLGDWVAGSSPRGAMARIEAHPAYREAIATFCDHPYATRLSRRAVAPPPRPRGLLRRIFSSPPPPEPDPPARQVKWILEGWLPPGDHRFGDVFHRARDAADAVVTSPLPLLAWTVELWELAGPRYVHWHFHGTLLRLLDEPGGRGVLIHEAFRTG